MAKNLSGWMVRLALALRLIVAWACGAACYGVPIIVSQPGPEQFVDSSQRVEFQVGIVESEPTIYQWYRNGFPIAGGTTSTLVIPSISPVQRGRYQLRASDSTGEARSNVLFVNVAGTTSVRCWTWNLPLRPLEEYRDIVMISSSRYLGAALRKNGTVVTWGGNVVFGQTSKIDVPVGLDHVVSVAAGFAHILALRSDGTVVAWGENTSAKSTVPAGLDHVIAVAAGLEHSAALRDDGTLVTWGRIQNVTPPGLTNLVAVASGEEHLVVLQGDGTPLSWGSGVWYNVPPPAGLTGLVEIGASIAQSYGVKADGSVVRWGGNLVGQGNLPTGLSDVAAISGMAAGGAALRSNGNLVFWGDDFYPGLSANVGNITQEAALEYLTPPVIMSNPQAQTASAAGDAEFAVVARGGGLRYQWQCDGVDVPGACGPTLRLGLKDGLKPAGYSVRVSNPLGMVVSSTAALTVNGPVFLQNPKKCQWITSGASAQFHAAVSTIGTPKFQWLKNGFAIPNATTDTLAVSNVSAKDFGYYQLRVVDSSGTAMSQAAFLRLNAYTRILDLFSNPQAPPQVTDVVAIAGDSINKLAARRNGELVYWATNPNSSGYGSYPPAINSLDGVISLSVEGWMQVALTEEGAVRGLNGLPWNEEGISVPNAVQVAVGGSGFLALLGSGRVIARGVNYNGFCNVPSELNDAVAVATGDYYGMALRGDGSLITWGGIDIGFGGTNFANFPMDLHDIRAIRARSTDASAVRADGSVRLWLTAGFSNLPSDGFSNIAEIEPTGVIARQTDGSILRNGTSTGVTNGLAISAGLVLQQIFPPVVSSIPNQTIAEGGTVGALAFTVSDADTPIANLTLSASSSNTGLLPLSRVVVSGTGANRTVSISPEPHQLGTSNVYLIARDDLLEGNTQFALQVNGTPTASRRFRSFGTTEVTPQTSDGADADGDGRPNLLEWAMGADPNSSASTPVTVTGTVFKGTTFEFPWDNTNTDLVGIVERSINLVDWTPIASSVGGVFVSKAGDITVSQSGPSGRQHVQVLSDMGVESFAEEYFRVRIVK